MRKKVKKMIKKNKNKNQFELNFNKIKDFIS